VQPIIYDGTCGSCEEGLVNCCDNNGFVGLSGKLFWGIWEISRIFADLATFSGWGGGLSDFVVVPEYCVIKVPDNVPLDVAGEFPAYCCEGFQVLTTRQHSSNRSQSAGMP
jgi:threonine dehydrogenase-like Zn-dependent dehydrogenase